MLGTLDFLERYNAGQLSEEERAAKTIEAESRGRGCRKKSLADDRGASERQRVAQGTGSARACKSPEGRKSRPARETT